MRLPTSVRLLLPAAVATAILASGCGGGKSSGPSSATVNRVTAADVTSVLKSHNINIKGSISCVGIAPGVIDCHGTTSTGEDIQAALVASTAGQTCQGPMVVNVNKTQLVNLPDEKCA